MSKLTDKLQSLLEPDSMTLAIGAVTTDTAQGDAELLALFSIAISLKRIADEFDGKPDRLGMSEMLYEISQKVNRG